MTSSEPKMLLWIPQMTLPELFMKRPSTKRWEYGLGLFLAYWWNAYLIPVRIDPGILISTWSWSECVLDVPKFSGPGPGRSWISQIFPVLVRFGPRFLKIFGSGPVLNFSKFFVPGPVWFYLLYLITWFVFFETFQNDHKITLPQNYFTAYPDSRPSFRNLCSCLDADVFFSINSINFRVFEIIYLCSPEISENFCRTFITIFSKVLFWW